MQYSIVDFKIIKENSDFRIDSEYYHPEFIQNHNLLNKFDIVDFTDFDIQFGTTPKGATFEEEGIPFIRSQNFSKGFIDHDNLVYITNEDHLKQIRSEVINRDILIASVGATIGQVGLSTIDKGNINQNVSRIRIKSDEFCPEFLFIFLKSKFGQYQLGKLNTGNAQAYLNSLNIASLFAVKVSDHLQNTIKRLVTLSYNITRQSQSLYSQAEQFLLSEINLTNWKPKHRLTFVKNYSDTKQSGRIDADYYQPEYEHIEKTIKNYSNGYSTIRAEFKQNKSTFDIDNKKTYKYVEISSINVSNGEITSSELSGKELPVNAKRVLKKDDIIISKVRTYRGAVTIVEKNGYVGSGAFTALRENGRINKETLLAFLHSAPLLYWSLKPNTGTSYPVIADGDILNLPIPLLPKRKQTQIQQKVIESFQLRKQSKRLLECAKRAVEIAIEKNEKQAMKWLEKEKGKIQKQKRQK
ncbi:MAG: hypothetical protein OXF52_06430 [Candidatus Dadabacteria bacterium]|nr:hypothetical protein [Candidatus Dadabacteria bacterium]